MDVTTDSLIADSPLTRRILELAELERRTWPARLAAIPSWHPRNEGDDDDEDDDKDKDDDKSKSKDDDKSKSKGGGKDDDKDKDDDEDDEDRSAAGFKRLRKENADLKRKAEERDRKAREESGKFEDLYNEERGKVETAETKAAEAELNLEVVLAATAEGARNPKRVMRLMRADGLLDDIDVDDVERAVKRFKRSDSDLFGKPATRQTRRRERDDDDDDDRTDDDDDRTDDRDDDRTNGGRSKSKQPVNRLRRGIEATNPKTSRARH